MLGKESDAISVENDSDTTASSSQESDTIIGVQDDSDTTVSFSRDQDVGLYDIGRSSGVEEVETSYVEEGNVVHGEEQQTAKVAVVENVPGKVHGEAVEEQGDRWEDHEQDAIEKQLDLMLGEGTPSSPIFEKELESMEEGGVIMCQLCGAEMVQDLEVL